MERFYKSNINILWSERKVPSPELAPSKCRFLTSSYTTRWRKPTSLMLIEQTFGVMLRILKKKISRRYKDWRSRISSSSSWETSLVESRSREGAVPNQQKQLMKITGEDSSIKRNTLQQVRRIRSWISKGFLRISRTTRWEWQRKAH